MSASENALRFLAGLTGSALDYHGQLREQEQAQTEQERRGIESVIEAALSSPNLRPEAIPHLLTLGMSAHGAKKKDLEQVKSLFAGLVGQGVDTTNTVSDTSGPVTPDSSGPQVTDSERAPSMTYTAHKPLFMSPQEVITQNAQRKGAETAAVQEALDPNREKERQLKRDLAAEKAKQALDILEVRLQNSLILVDARLRGAAQAKAQQKRQAYLDSLKVQNNALPMAERLSDEELDAKAAGMTLRDMQSGVILREANTALADERRKAIPEQLALARRRANQADRSLDIREWAQDALDYHREVTRSLQANRGLQQQFGAETKEIVSTIGKLQTARNQLENKMLTDIYMSEDQKTTAEFQLVEYDSQLAVLRGQLQTIGKKYSDLSQSPSPRTKGGGRGSRYVPQKVSPKDLEDLLK